MKVSAFYSLALRPMAINGAYMFALAMLVPGMMPSNLAEPFFVYWGRDVVPAAVSDLLWRETLMLGAASGIVAGAMAASLRFVQLSGTLPGVRRAVSLGTLQIMLVVLLITAYLHHGLAGHPLAAVGITAVGFTAGVLQMNGIQWNVVRLIAIVLLLTFVRPDVLVDAAALAPLPLTLLALLAPASAVWLTHSLRSPTALRRQAMSAMTRDLPIGWRHLVERIDRRPPMIQGTGRWVSWLRIANSANLPDGGSWVKAPAGAAAWWSVLGYFFFGGQMSFFIFPVYLWLGSGGLPGNLLYPVSRGRRATVAYLSAMSFTVVFSAVTVGVTSLLYTLKPFAGMMAEVPTLDTPLLPMVGILAVWCPLAMWVALRPPDPEPLARARATSGGPYAPALIGVTLLYMLCVILSLYAHDSLIATLAPLYQSLVFAGVAAVTHTFFLIILYRSYGTRDLV